MVSFYSLTVQREGGRQAGWSDGEGSARRRRQPALTVEERSDAQFDESLSRGREPVAHIAPCPFLGSYYSSVDRLADNSLTELRCLPRFESRVYLLNTPMRTTKSATSQPGFRLVFSCAEFRVAHGIGCRRHRTRGRSIAAKDDARSSSATGQSL